MIRQRVAVVVATTTALLTVAAPAAAGAVPSLQAAGAAWSCDAFGYLFQSPANGTHVITRVNLATGASTRLSTTRGNLNAAGYNTLDNFVYAWDATSGGIVRVASDGTISPVGDPTHTGDRFTIGDFDNAGHLFLSLQGTREPWYEIDLAPGSAAYGKVIARGARTTPAGLASGADWSWVGGALYMLDLPLQGPKTPHLVRFTPSTGITVDLGALPFTVPGAFTGPLLNVFGATYADQAGNLYASYNGGGQIYRIPLDNIRSAGLLTVGPATSYNDGARCLRGPSPLGATGWTRTFVIVTFIVVAVLLIGLLFLLARRRRRTERDAA